MVYQLPTKILNFWEWCHNYQQKFLLSLRTSLMSNDTQSPAPSQIVIILERWRSSTVQVIFLQFITITEPAMSLKHLGASLPHTCDVTQTPWHISATHLLCLCHQVSNHGYSFMLIPSSKPYTHYSSLGHITPADQTRTEHFHWLSVWACVSQHA
jgi:hypothetical protein